MELFQYTFLMKGYLQALLWVPYQGRGERERRLNSGVPPVDNPYSHEYTQNLLVNRLESMQYNAALVITGSWRGTSRETIHTELGWESLNDRRWSRGLVLF